MRELNQVREAVEYGLADMKDNWKETNSSPRNSCTSNTSFQTYRGVPKIKWREILEDSFKRISEVYNQVRSYSLLEFSKVPNEQLKMIWHELGRVKENDGNTNQCGYEHGHPHVYIATSSKSSIGLYQQVKATSSARENESFIKSIAGVRGRESDESIAYCGTRASHSFSVCL